MKESFSGKLDEQVLDRLVDGELTPAEYQRALLSLDEEPDGWRRCALAFLEAQSFSRELAVPRRETLPARPHAEPKTRQPLAGGGQRSRFGLLFAMVASFLLAFAATAPFRMGWFNQNPEPPVPGPADIADTNSSRSVLEARDSQIPPRSTTPNRDAEPVGSVSLVVDGGVGHRSQEIDVPVYRGREIPLGSLLPEEPNLPPEFLDSLRRSGHRIHRHSQLVPVELQDGRQLVVPLDEYQIVPVGSFQ